MISNINNTHKKVGMFYISQGMVTYIILCIIMLLIMSLAFKTFSVFIVGIIGLCIVLSNSSGVNINATRVLPLIQIVFILVMIALYYGLIAQYGEPYYAGDDKIFENGASYLISQDVWWFSDIPYMEGLFYAKGYPLIISWMMRISDLFGGYHTIIPRIINGYLWTGIVLMISKQLPESFWNEKKCKNLFICFAIFPNALYISGFVYRDTLVLFILVVFYCALKKIIGHKFRVSNLWQIAKIVLSLYLIYYLRSQLLYVMLAMGLIVVFWDRSISLNFRWGRRLFIAFTALIILMVTGGVELLLEMSSEYNTYRENVIGGGLSNVIFSIPLIPFGVFFRFAWGLVSPFPGGILSLSYFKYPLVSLVQLVVYLGVIVQICMIPFLWKGVKKFDTKALVYLLIIMSVVVTTFTFRHMLLIYPFMFEVLADGVSNTHTSMSKKALPMLVLIAVAGVVYISIR